MTVRDTMTIPKHRQQVRGFAIVWTGITLIMGVCAFIAIYAATGIMVSNRAVPPAPISIAAAKAQATSDVTTEPTLGPIASFTPAAIAMAAQVTATPQPNQPVVATAAPTQAQAATQAASGSGGGNAQAGGATATLKPVSDTAFDLGIQVQENADPKTYELWMKMVSEQLKLNWFKSQVRWKDLEKTKGTFDFGTLDIIMPLASKYSVKVLLSIVTAPDWAREKGANLKQNGPPADPQDYVNFVTTIVKRYPAQVHAIEVYNEENLDREWTSTQGLKAANYVALLSATYKAVKAIDPNIVIISGALSPVGASDPPRYVDDFVYMDALIKAGLLQTVDCVGAHHNGYNIGPTVSAQAAPSDPKGRRSRFRGPFDNVNHSWSFKSTLEGYAAKIKAAGGSQKLCITEFGWPSMEGIKTKDGKQAAPKPGFEFASDNTLADQADYTNQALDVMQGWGFVQLAFLWNLNYGPQEGWNPQSDNVPYSIIGPDYQNRPVWQKIVDRNFRGKARTAQ